MADNNIDFSLPQNWHIKLGQEPKAVVYVAPLPETDHPLEREALASLAQYLPSAAGEATLATHISANGDYFYQKAYGQWHQHFAEIMNSLRFTLEKHGSEYQLTDDNVDRNLDAANPDYWKVTQWRVTHGDAPNEQAKQSALGEDLFFYDHITWQINLDYDHGKACFEVTTIYAWPIYR